MSLKLARSLALPIEIVTQKTAWLGVTGSGKTYGASKLAELFWQAGAQFVVLDPVGVWYGLRLAGDGRAPSAINIPIFGGLHGDVPLEKEGGELVANLIVDKTLSVILDVSQFESDTDKARFARDFIERFFFRKKAAPSAVHLFLEECQEFVPQNPQKGEERMLHAYIRTQKLGRNFGIGSSYISQRPQEVNKKALNMAQTLFVFRTTGTHERKAIEAWIADKALDQDIAGDLPKLETGVCHVWSPEFLKISETVHVLKKATFNASATPEVGVAAKARELAPIDLEKVRTEMAATIEKAKADDPRFLRQELAKLRAELGRAHRTAPPAPAVVKETRLRASDRQALEAIAKRMEAARAALAKAGAETAAQLAGVLERASKDLGAALQRPDFAALMAAIKAPAPLQVPAARAMRPAYEPRQAAADRAPRPPAPAGAWQDDHRLTRRPGELKKVARAILTALAQHPDGLTREQTLILAGYVPSGDTSTAIAALLEYGLVQEARGTVQITRAGEEVLGPFEPLPQGAELRAHLLNGSKLTSAEKKLLRALFEHWPNGFTRGELCEAAGLKPSGDTSVATAKFIKLGWAEDTDRGVVASETFFPEGL